MKQDVALRVLGEIMNWTAEEARREFAWLNLMARIKYDTYRDFVAGVRFVESLADWLQQFEQAERCHAYEFVRERLIYISPPEVQHLVELVYPEAVQRHLLAAVAKRSGVPTHLVWADSAVRKMYDDALCRTLFLGLSDGARMDTFRRCNTGIVSNEQVVVATELDEAKWKSLQKALSDATATSNALFETIFLIDDFVGSGKTLIRQDNGNWDGKLAKFFNRNATRRGQYFAGDPAVCVHHYLASHAASMGIVDAARSAAETKGEQWFPAVEFSFGMILPVDVPISAEACPDFMRLVDRCYDPSIESTHTSVGGTQDVKLGFGHCALPLVLEHNTPNNSIALLWADTAGEDSQHAMRPLFRRRQRHV